MAAWAISRAWASDNDPARNASATTGRSASSPTISMVAIAVPTAVPVFDAIQAAAERNPSRRHNALSSNVAVANTRNAASSRSASAHCSTTQAASVPLEPVDVDFGHQ